MRYVRTGNLTLVTLMAEDINHRMNDIDRVLRSFVQPHQLVGLVTFLPDKQLEKSFEALIDNAATGVARAWSGKGQALIGYDGQLSVNSWLPGIPTPVEYVPQEDDDILIGDFPLNRANLSTFLNALNYHRPLPLRKSHYRL